MEKRSHHCWWRDLHTFTLLQVNARCLLSIEMLIAKMVWSSRTPFIAEPTRSGSLSSCYIIVVPIWKIWANGYSITLLHVLSNSSWVTSSNQNLSLHILHTLTIVHWNSILDTAV
jgi:hypothetical protein